MIDTSKDRTYFFSLFSVWLQNFLTACLSVCPFTYLSIDLSIHLCSCMYQCVFIEDFISICTCGKSTQFFICKCIYISVISLFSIFPVITTLEMSISFFVVINIYLILPSNSSLFNNITLIFMFSSIHLLTYLLSPCSFNSLKSYLFYYAFVYHKSYFSV